MSVHESPGPQPRAVSPLLLRIVAARSESTRGVGTDRTAAGPVPLPRQCPAARRPPVTPPAAGPCVARRSRVASGAVSLCPVRGFWYSEVVLKPTRVTFGACPLRGFPGPVKARGTRPYAGAVALLPKNRTARYRINPEPRLAARPGPRPATRLGVDDRTGTWRPLHGCGSRHTPRRGPTVQARRTSSPGSSVVNCAIGIPSTERPEWPTSHRECQE
jgi:hypothetical protein